MTTLFPEKVGAGTLGHPVPMYLGAFIKLLVAESYNVDQYLS